MALPTPAPSMRANVRARCRMLLELRSRLVAAARSQRGPRGPLYRQIDRVEGLLVTLGAAYFEARQSGAVWAR